VKSLKLCRFVTRSAARSRCSTESAQGTNAPTRRTLQQQPHFLNFRDVFDDWKIYLLEGVQSLRRVREMPAPPDKNSCGRSEFGRDHVPTNKPAARRVDGAELSGQRRGVHCSVAIIASYIDVAIPAPSLNRTDVSSIVQLRKEFFTKDRLSHHAYYSERRLL
jgi:hypothetical protein